MAEITISKPNKKLNIVKSIPNSVYKLDDIIRTDLEDNNRGFYILSGSGKLTLICWIKKFVKVEVIEDVSE